MQFLAESMVESIEILERLANPNVPPLDLEQIETMKRNFKLTHPPSKEKSYDAQMNEMEKAFRGRGDVTEWREEILSGIDDIFVKTYKDSNTGLISDSLFFPNSPDNYDRFDQYCQEVDQFLRERPDQIPMNAQVYFGYFTMWRTMGYAFPMPLGTASVIEALHNIVSRHRIGFSEVSIHSFDMVSVNRI